MTKSSSSSSFTTTTTTTTRPQQQQEPQYYNKHYKNNKNNKNNLPLRLVLQPCRIATTTTETWNQTTITTTTRMTKKQSKRQNWLRIPKVPDFIIVGAQKCGTTALASLLEKHPYIVRSQRFEEHFFDM